MDLKFIIDTLSPFLLVILPITVVAVGPEGKNVDSAQRFRKLLVNVLKNFEDGTLIIWQIEGEV